MKTTYKLECDEPFYVRTTFNEQMEQVKREVDSSEGLQHDQHYYWITSTERDDVLVVDSFGDGEYVLEGLREGEYIDFEEATDDNPHTTRIRKQRPPY